ncbi:hypothetical protein GUJ93_ZPchr0013g35375 [Zizania palustris]|uniref:Uncharacterized protein n=1 Tax=Zizania palustris TaxID=103762 RepID=A0A8J5X0X3_ZIZPA|nr:hypothetical protein GUJ93_ZPchr0013g35375 [Zizania palustris]
MALMLIYVQLQLQNLILKHEELAHVHLEEVVEEDHQAFLQEQAVVEVLSHQLQVEVGEVELLDVGLEGAEEVEHLDDHLEEAGEVEHLDNHLEGAEEVEDQVVCPEGVEVEDLDVHMEGVEVLDVHLEGGVEVAAQGVEVQEVNTGLVVAAVGVGVGVENLNFVSVVKVVVEVEAEAEVEAEK